MSHSLHGPLHDVAQDAGYADPPERAGFFTDTSVCIGCKACEVACKEWNALPDDGFALTGMSYDNTAELGASTWRHVAFVEQSKPHEVGDGDSTRWLMASDVCKHCTHAACLDVCPTGALCRTEFATVVVQQDICNGCAYCVSACPGPPAAWPSTSAAAPSTAGPTAVAGTCCSMNATCRQVEAPRPIVLSNDMPVRVSPSSGTAFHSLQATSQALQPMQTDVSVKKPIRGGCSPYPARAAGS
ncbi:MAG: 4Fe-4S ferredoxin, partial [Actinoallomurus sp.]|nr:4Fe-4S ferredoxin [Actinoallomurus sp.]